MKYFNITEFDSPDELGSGEKMCEDFLDKIDLARSKFDKPININSGYRSKAHNKKVGGKSKSSHLVGCAADLHCNNSIDRYDLINCLLDVGFNRLGIAKTFIHIDCDPDKTPNVVWVY
tara:strand:- start:83 stop:436 length:354 start_codon:yes stop_codon:yes gene_type:complete